MNPKSKEFLSLQKKWYGKLKDEGFEDIEQDEEHLKIWSSHFFKVHYNETLYQAKEDYYRLAGQFLHDHPFKNSLERAIWELHSQGVSIRNIVKSLKRRYRSVYRNKVHTTIQRLTQEMITKCR